MATRTLVWGVGVEANPLIRRLGLPTRAGRLGVDPELAVQGVPGVWAAGDAAAVPDLTARENDRMPDTPPTAQHAQRQGTVLGRNIAADLGVGRPEALPAQGPRPRRRPGRLGRRRAAAGVPLTGPMAKVVTRGYHLYALPAMANRVRVAADSLFQTVLPPEDTQLSVVRPEDARLAWAQGTNTADGERASA